MKTKHFAVAILVALILPPVILACSGIDYFECQALCEIAWNQEMAQAGAVCPGQPGTPDAEWCSGIDLRLQSCYADCENCWGGPDAPGCAWWDVNCWYPNYWWWI